MKRRSTFLTMAGLVSRLFVFSIFIGSCGGELASPELSPANTLRQRFPGQAAQVIEHGEAFVATADGFALARVSGQGAWGAAVIALPRDGRDTIRLRGFRGAEVQVRELGVEGEGALVERSVAYRRAGGTSFWTATFGGAEEWLHLEANAVRAGEAVAAWEVTGATVRQHGEGVEVVDADGVMRLSVTAPKAYGAGGREVGARLVGNGATIELRVDVSGEEVLVDPLWMTGSPMSVARYFHTATRLNNNVLVTGGPGTPLPLNSAELYDPAANTWSTAGVMSTGRYSHTATLLNNGKVLVTAAFAADLYDPATNTWAATGAMTAHRENHTATLLPSGMVLVVGGNRGDQEVYDQTELYDPAIGMWSPAGLLTGPRTIHTATQLPNGKILVTGGFALTSAPGEATTEVRDPVTGTWAAAGVMSQGRGFHTATLLNSGKVLVAGGSPDYSGSSMATAELYDSATDNWSAAGAMNQARQGHKALLLNSGKVLVIGGLGAGNSTLASAELYDPATDTWSLTDPMSTARTGATATLLVGGEVFVAGGANSMGPQSSTELYTPPVLAALGSPCTQAAACASGFCADGVCCDTVCNAGSCDACSMAGGATTDGTCGLLTGATCDDANACTATDTCAAGVCVGANPVVCAMPDACHTAGTCDPSTGMCSNPAKVDGAACNDNDGCTQTDTCLAGACVGNSPVSCPMPDQCHDAGTCDPTTGMCSMPTKANGTACTDSNGCTASDTCQAGVCVGASSVVCTAPDDCHDAGTCDPTTGMCAPVAKPDNTPCAGGLCMAGMCVPQGSSSSSSSSSSGGGAGGDGGSAGAGGSGGASSSSSSSSSSSGGGTGGTGGAGVETDFPFAAGGGCSCDVVGPGASTTPWASGAALGLLALLRRRNRARAHQG